MKDVLLKFSIGSKLKISLQKIFDLR